MLEKIISGGQTGADKAALRAAKAAGLKTGGTVPRGWRTELGTDLSLRAFAVVESESSNYAPRTKMNVLNSDGTLLISKKPLRSGSRFTIDTCQFYRKPYFLVDVLGPYSMWNVRVWFAGQQIKVLNVAGSRESKWPGLEQEATAWLTELFKRIISNRAASPSDSIGSDPSDASASQHPATSVSNREKE